VRSIQRQAQKSAQNRKTIAIERGKSMSTTHPETSTNGQWTTKITLFQFECQTIAGHYQKWVYLWPGLAFFKCLFVG